MTRDAFHRKVTPAPVRGPGSISDADTCDFRADPILTAASRACRLGFHRGLAGALDPRPRLPPPRRFWRPGKRSAALWIERCLTTSATISDARTHSRAPRSRVRAPTVGRANCAAKREACIHPSFAPVAENSDPLRSHDDLPPSKKAPSEDGCECCELRPNPTRPPPPALQERERTTIWRPPPK
jgi:hypothetical protein